MTIMSTPPWAHWFLEIEDLKFPANKEFCNNDAEFHFDLNAVIGALDGDQVQATRDVIDELTQHAYPNVGDRCEIVMGDVLIRLMRVQ